jgi:hypothetical protein
MAAVVMLDGEEDYEGKGFEEMKMLLTCNDVVQLKMMRAGLLAGAFQSPSLT